MDYRVLGQTGLRVSALGIGGWQLSGPLVVDGMADGFPDLGRDSAVTLIHACGDLGINLIDTAEIYGNGEGEQRVGVALRGRREGWVICTKFGLRCGPQQQRIANSEPETIRSSLEGSLRRLQTDYVDIYLYHCPPDPRSILAGKQVLDQLQQEGKLRFYGISIDQAAVLGQLVEVGAAQVAMFAQSLIEHPQGLLQLAKVHDLGVMVRGALAAGQLSGQYFHQPPQFSREDIRDRTPLPWQKYAFYEQLLPPGMSMTTLALRYLLDFETTHTIILGGKSLNHYQEALKALEVSPLDANIHRAIQRARGRLAIERLGKKLLRPVSQPLQKLILRKK
ncbi:MAG: aldo/keto reductase [Acaryochloridaceae cyanobacterium SU_2_1]|nr:aldo/keto reductase [Acaryochloridaceae cyanobacterium SU_2_1]